MPELTPDQRELHRAAMRGNRNSKGRKPFKWRVGVPADERRRIALTEAGVKLDWASGGYVGVSTMFDNEAKLWIDSVQKLGYKVKYFRRPKPEDVLVI